MMIVGLNLSVVEIVAVAAGERDAVVARDNVVDFAVAVLPVDLMFVVENRVRQNPSIAIEMLDHMKYPMALTIEKSIEIDFWIEYIRLERTSCCG